MIDILQLKRVVRGADSDDDLVRDHLASAIEPQIIEAARATQRQEYAINVHMDTFDYINIISAQDIAIEVLHERGYKTSIDNEHDIVHIYW